MQPHKIVSHEEWQKARKVYLEKEKEFGHLRDELSAQRQALPWEKVEKRYVFETEKGKKTLAELFGKNSQLVVYHFMWLDKKNVGCSGCSFLADHFDGANLHLKHHDVSLVVASRAPLQKLLGYKKRMGWKFKWVSSEGSDFNFDYHVSFTKDQLARGKVDYNYEMIDNDEEELPGLSVFYKDDKGDIFHTYSTYARGLDPLLGTYHFLELTPKGRNEEKGMDWMRRHDEYEGAGSSCCHDA